MNKSHIDMITVIVDRGKSKKVTDILSGFDATMQMVMLGHGTARSDMMDYLGLDEPEKDVIMATIPPSLVPEVLSTLKQRLKLSRPGTGVAFITPLSAFTASLVHCNHTNNKEETHMHNTYSLELVIAIVKRGYSDIVMHAAKEVGTTGGTVVRAYGVAPPEPSEILHMAIKPEKDMVFMAVSHDIRSDVMKAIHKKVREESGENAVLFSLPITDSAGLPIKSDN